MAVFRALFWRSVPHKHRWRYVEYCPYKGKVFECRRCGAAWGTAYGLIDR